MQKIKMTFCLSSPAYPDAFSPRHFESSRNSARNRIPGQLNDPSTNLEGLVTRRTPGSPVDRSPEVITKGKWKIFVTKCIFITCILANEVRVWQRSSLRPFSNSHRGFLIFATWWWSKYYYIYLPLITITVALNCVMVVSVVLHVIAHRISQSRRHPPESRAYGATIALLQRNLGRGDEYSGVSSRLGQYQGTHEGCHDWL